MERNYGFEFLEDFDINSIDVATKEGVWSQTLREWEESGAKTLKFSLKSAEEKSRCYGAVVNYNKTHKKDWTIYPERNKYNIYVVRA